MYLQTAAAPPLPIRGLRMFLCSILTVVLLRLHFMLAEVPDSPASRPTEPPSLLPIVPTPPSPLSTPCASLCVPPSPSASIPRTSPYCLIPARRSCPARDRARLPVLTSKTTSCSRSSMSENLQ